MSKNIIIIVLLIAVAGLAFLKFKPQMKEEVAENKTGTQESRKMPPAPPKSGDKFSDTTVFASAVQVFPGDLTEAARNALTGFDMTTSKNDDGTTQVTFIPKDQDDQKSSYKVAEGQTLYFVEMSKGDDNEDTNKDMFLRDDYGILVDKDGIVQ